LCDTSVAAQRHEEVRGSDILAGAFAFPFSEEFMKSVSFRSLGASSLLCALLLCPALGQSPAGAVSAQSRQGYVPLFAVIEAIEFNGVSPELQKVTLDRIGMRVGDTLNGEARQRIARELGKVRQGMTFTYRPGAKPGTAKLIISADC
jgi:hypothetical protein